MREENAERHAAKLRIDRRKIAPVRGECYRHVRPQAE
jgi:hypothetical protein